MKILVATGLTQGMEANDYHYCIEGELVWIQEPCASGRNDPEGGCGRQQALARRLGRLDGHEPEHSTRPAQFPRSGHIPSGAFL